MSWKSSAKVGLKRKAKSTGKRAVLHKRRKYEVSSLDDLPWRPVMRPKEAGLEGDDGILMLEEIEGVDVLYEDTPAGRIAKFNFPGAGEQPAENEDTQLENPLVDANGDSEGSSHELQTSLDQRTGTHCSVKDHPDGGFDVENLLPKWAPFSLHPSLYASLHQQNFTKPTPIQERALPAAMTGKDVVGVAETGSGKTLAYGLPILHYLRSSCHVETHISHNQAKRRLKALILAPTRELALQVSEHLKACQLHNSEPVAEETGTHAQPLISVAAVVGGMSAQKQHRVIQRGVDVIVATPGRLWDLIGEDESLAKQIKSLRFLVLDEADRMVETGHFAELENIVRLTLRQPPETADDRAFANAFSAGANADETSSTDQEQLQTFVFSATLSKDLQRNMQKPSRAKWKPNKKGKGKPASTLDDLLMRLDFRDPDPEIIDLSPDGGAVATLKESQVECLSADKDVYLYYFLLRYPGRSLVFLSSIDGIRRLLPLLELLELKAFPLHSQLQQRQRLKNLDRFKSTKNSILLATDVAARGLDVPSVDHVVHYQIPRSADLYIHRNGRTARAQRLGFSLLLCAPDERRIIKGLLASVQKNDVPDMPIELDLLDKLKGRVQLAKKIDTAQHQLTKEKHDRNWMKKAAEAMDIELDSDFAISDDDESHKVATQRAQKTQDAKSASLKIELKRLLSQPMIARGISTKYITSGTRSIVNELMDSEQVSSGMIGFERSDAINAVSHTKRHRNIAVHAHKATHNDEEWMGFDQ